MRGVNHGGVVDRGEVAVDQIELVEAQHGGPDGLDLNVGKVFSYAAMPAWGRRERVFKFCLFSLFLRHSNIL